VDKQVLRRWRNGFGAHLYGQAVVVCIQLVGVPVLLHFWGAQLYGEWLILSAIPVYLSMTDLGFSQSAANDMTQRMARGDVEGAVEVFQSLGVLVLAVVLVGLILVVAVVWILPIGRLMHFHVLSSTDVRWVLSLLAAEVLVRLADGVSHAGYRATGDYALHVGIYYSVLLLQSISVWVAAIAGAGAVTAAGAMLCVRIVATPIVGLVLVERHGELSFGFRHAARRSLRGLFRPAVANVSMPLAQALSGQGMVLAIGGTLGAVAVVVFSTLRTLTRLALQAVLTVSQAAEPEFAAAYGASRTDVLNTLFIYTLRAGIWLSLAAAVLLLTAGGPILEVWTRGRVAMDPALFRWLLTSAVLGSLWYSSLTVLKAANRHVRSAGLYAVAAAAAVVMAVVLLRATGRIVGAGVALVAVDLTMIVYTLPAASRLCSTAAVHSLVAALNPVPLVDLARSTLDAD
jgi:O-antigen/teichoic acid export membrane protein